MNPEDQHGKYGDTPLGKSDEELRDEGAEALTEAERHHQPSEEAGDVAALVPVAGLGGSAAAGWGAAGSSAAALAPGLLSSEAEREDEQERRED